MACFSVRNDYISKILFWDGDEKVELPRWGFGMELRRWSSRDEALG